MLSDGVYTITLQLFRRKKCLLEQRLSGSLQELVFLKITVLSRDLITELLNF